MHIPFFLFPGLKCNMNNGTALTFTMTAYAVLENYKHALFVVFLLLYLLTLMLNLVLVTIIRQRKDLHQPMNIFMCMLFINEIYGSTALCPSVMSLLISNSYETPLKWCLAQVYFLHTYASAEFCVLALMGYDRYLAICYPLHYHSTMSNSRISKLIALTVLYPSILFGCFYSLTLQLSFCGRVIPKLYCVNMEVVRNSCTNISHISIAGLFLILVFVVPQMLMIIVSYAQISRVCWKLTRKSRRNALRTCVPHLLSLLNFSMGSIFEIIQTRFNMRHVATEVRIFLSLYFVVITPIANPLLYGLGTQVIRVHFLKLFTKYKIMPAKFAREGISAWFSSRQH